MIIKILIFLGWRGVDCKECGFSHAGHFDYNLSWHPDYYPCNNFKAPKEEKGS